MSNRGPVKDWPLHWFCWAKYWVHALGRERLWSRVYWVSWQGSVMGWLSRSGAQTATQCSSKSFSHSILGQTPSPYKNAMSMCSFSPINPAISSRTSRWMLGWCLPKPLTRGINQRAQRVGWQAMWRAWAASPCASTLRTEISRRLRMAWVS